MIITCEINLRNFEGWSGAKDTLSALTTQQLDIYGAKLLAECNEKVPCVLI